MNALPPPCHPPASSTAAPNMLQVRVELYDVRRTKFIQAHSSPLVCMALSLDGKLLATASERGTLVRIHSTADASKLQVGGRHSSPVWQCKHSSHWHFPRCSCLAGVGQIHCSAGAGVMASLGSPLTGQGSALLGAA